MHVQGGNIKEHLRAHQIHINRGLLDDNTEILRTECCPSRLKLYEALFISREKPRNNTQKDFTDGTLSLFNCVSIPIKVNTKVGTSKFVSTTVDGHPTIPDSVAVQSLQNNASVKSFHDGDIKGTSNKDSALRNKTCVVLGKTGVSDVIVDGFVSDVNL